MLNGLLFVEGLFDGFTCASESLSWFLLGALGHTDLGTLSSQ